MVLVLLLVLAALLLAGERNRRRHLPALASHTVLQPPQLAVQEFADREQVRLPDSIVKLVGIAGNVVELLLAGRPLDVLPGAEADALVVLGRAGYRGLG